jgi:hypothetical protein
MNLVKLETWFIPNVYYNGFKCLTTHICCCTMFNVDEIWCKWSVFYNCGWIFHVNIDFKVPSISFMDVMKICYPQYWLQIDLK